MDAGLPGQMNTATATPQISVVVFSYNFGPFIGECLESLVRQTLRPAEIIVCDDCSTDNAWDIIQQYKTAYPDLFRIFRHEVNIGHIENGIFGKDQVRGNLVTLMDGDDRWHPDKLRLEWQALQQNPRAKTAYSGVNLIDAQGNVIGTWMDPSGKPPPSGDVFLQTLAKRFFPNTVSLFRNQLIYTDVMRELGYKGHHKRLIHADWNLKIKLAARAEVAYSGKPLVDYRQHGTSIHKVKNDHLYVSAQHVIAKNIALLRTRTDAEIDYVLAGINALMIRLATRCNKPIISFSRANIFPPKVLGNSLSHAGGQFLRSVIGLLPGIQHADTAFEQRAGEMPAKSCIQTRIDVPAYMPALQAEAMLSGLKPGDAVTGAIPYSKSMDALLREQQMKMVMVLRDPRDAAVAHAQHVTATPAHPFHAFYA
ncbi:MAG: glycosyltransferase, partial [Bacteroidota bacterium]